MKNKYFITWQYSYLEYPTNRFETLKYKGMSMTCAHWGIEHEGTWKSVVEIDDELSTEGWEQFINDFEEDKAKELVEQDLDHRDHVHVSVTGITKL